MRKFDEKSVDGVGASVLFCLNRLAPTLELAPVMRAVAKDGGRPIAFLGSKCLSKQIPLTVLDGIETEILTSSLWQKLRTLPASLFGLIGKAFRLFRLHFFADVFATLSNIVKGYDALNRVLKRYQVRVVVVADDRNLDWGLGAVLAARSMGLATVAVPFALSDPDADWIARATRDAYDPLLGGWVDRYFKRIMRARYPENTRARNGRELMFLTAGQAWVLKALNAAFRRPWAYGGGITTFVSIFGEMDKAKQIALGVAEEKLIVTGQCSIDLLYNSRSKAALIRANLVTLHNMPVDRHVVICAVPQYLEHEIYDAPKHWLLTEQMLAALAATGANIVLSLHPLSRDKRYRVLAEQYGIAIATRPLIEVLPAADVFVASHSSTVRWAILMRIPTIVLDDLEIAGSAVYRGFSLHFLKNRANLAQLTRRLLRQHDTREVLISELEQQATGLDPFDGQSSVRVARMLGGLVSSTQGHV